jgi:hypothetical protein
MVVFGIVALIAGYLAFRQGVMPNPSSRDHQTASGFSSKPIGKTAISHGGSPEPPAVTGPYSLSTGSIPQGQAILVQHLASAPHDSMPIPILHSIPRSSSSPSEDHQGETPQSVKPGTQGIVIGMATLPAAESSRTRMYYQVRLSDGREGWLPDHVVQVASNAMPESIH